MIATGRSSHRASPTLKKLGSSRLEDFFTRICFTVRGASFKHKRFIVQNDFITPAHMPDPAIRGACVFLALCCSRLGLMTGLSTSGALGAAVVNGSFDDGLNGWQWSGEVFDVSAQAALLDSGTGRSLLWQAVEGPPGPALFGFDYRLALTGVGVPGSVPDVMFASLYFFNDPAAFDPVGFGGFGDAVEVADFDSRGVDTPSATTPGVSIGPSEKGPEFRRLEYRFEHPGGGIAPVFEVNSLNGIPGDSVAVVDNVILFLVPEPATPLLLLFASVAAAARRCRGARPPPSSHPS